MNDEIRLVSELSGGTYKNSCGCEIAVVKLQNNIMMTAKEIAKLYGVSRAYVAQCLGKFWKSGEFQKKLVSAVLTHRASDDKLYRTTYYNQEIIVAFGRFVKTDEVERFKNWLNSDSTKRLS